MYSAITTASPAVKVAVIRRRGKDFRRIICGD
jgi:hypothetical protein